jgi:triacylglycerol lipase
MPFDLTTKDDCYLKNAYHLAVLSKLAYSDNPAIEDTDLGKVFDPIEPFDTGRTEGFVAGNAQHVVVVFCGTNKPKDWLSNLDTVQVSGYGGKVHLGFHAALMQAWTSVVKKVRRLLTNGQTLWITGHSLGGALATLATRRLQLDESLPAYATFTFGAPRVFDPVAANKFRLLLYRFVNGKDIVPHVPPPLLLLRRYKHVGKLIHLLGDGQIDTSQSQWDKMKGVAVDFMTTAAEKDFIVPLEHHKIVRYIDEIRQTLETSRPARKRRRLVKHA